MTLLTPPPSVKKTAGLFRPYTRQVYYEDLYGTPNPDKELDVPDLCESDSDSENEEAIQQEGRGLFRSSKASDHTQSQQQTITHEVVRPTDPDQQETQYKIAPHINAKSSVPVVPSKTLVPKKFDMFAAFDPLDAGVVSDVESKDEEDAVSEGGELGSKSMGARGKRNERFSKNARSRQKRKSSGAKIERPKTRRLISREIAEYARERKAALRYGAGNVKAAAREMSTPKGSVRHPIVSKKDTNANAANDPFSMSSAKSRREMVQKASDARTASRGGKGSRAASMPKDESFQEVGDQEAEKLIKQKLWLKADTSSINVDEYVRYD